MDHLCDLLPVLHARDQKTKEAKQKMNENMKNVLLKLLETGGRALVESMFEMKSDPEEDKKKAQKELDDLKKQVVSSQKELVLPSALKPVIPIVESGRITRLGTNWYFIKGVVTTIFCNELDFDGETYPLATNSPYTLVHKGKMRDMRGVSLSVPIKSARIVYPIVPLTGVMFGYKQVDVGPGYTKDFWYTEGRAPLNESGVDMYGNPSAKAGLDMWPQCAEDLGLCSFELAYDVGWKGILDAMIFEPSGEVVSKVKGHDVPSSDSRPWVKGLPYSGSEFFPWKELLRGWNRQEKPKDEYIANMVKLVTEMLVPARKALGKLKVTNGLRDKETNARVGGREGSLHMVGRAVDLVPLECTFSELYSWINTNLKGKIRESIHENPGVANEHQHLSGPILPGEVPNIRIKK